MTKKSLAELQHAQKDAWKCGDTRTFNELETQIQTEQARLAKLKELGDKYKTISQALELQNYLGKDHPVFQQHQERK